MRIATSFVLSLGLLLLLACGGGSGSESEDVGDGITLSAPSSTVVEGFPLRITASSSNSQNATLLWMTDDLDVASVDEEGIVLGRSPGTATVAVFETATGALATIEIEVLPDADFNTTLPVDDGNLTPAVDRTIALERCEVSLHHTGIAASTTRGRSRRYHHLRLPHAGILGDLGYPELPFHRLLFAIPVDPVTQARATWSVEVERTSPVSYTGIRPWPHQPPRWIDADSIVDEVSPPFVVEEAAFARQAAWPVQSHGAEAVEIGNLPLLEVWVTPCQYLPAAGTLELFQTTRVVVTFESAGQLVMPRPLGDYKGIQEQGLDEGMADQVQNWGLLTSVGSGDLVAPLPPLDGLGYQDLPFDMLIVTRPSLADPARRLAQWRQDHGTRVWLAILDEGDYPDRDAIRDFIRTLDDLNRLDIPGPWGPRVMRALLLFGDVEHIPTFLGHNQRNNHDPTKDDDATYYVRVVGTDLPYSTLRGGDMQVDVALGRISVDDALEAGAVLSKIEAYESRPEGTYPTEAAAYGFFEDWIDPIGRIFGSFDFPESKPYVQVDALHFPSTVLSGLGFLDEKMVRPSDDIDADEVGWPVRVESLDEAFDRLVLEQNWPESTVSDVGLEVAEHDGQEDLMCVVGVERVRSYWEGHGVHVDWGYTRNRRPLTVPRPIRDNLGHALSGELTDPLHLWNVSESDIADFWNKGNAGIILHVGHGQPGYWQHPELNLDSLKTFTSSDAWYPIVLGINCSSGYFDAESDWVKVWDDVSEEVVMEQNTPANAYHNHHGESFCEGVLRKENGGGVAVVGASRGATSGYCDRLLNGLFAAMYADYRPVGVIPGSATRGPLIYMGDIFRAGKHVMYEWVRSPSGRGKQPSAEYCLQTFHLFGDPMLRVRLPRAGVAD